MTSWKWLMIFAVVPALGCTSTRSDLAADEKVHRSVPADAYHAARVAVKGIRFTKVEVEREGGRVVYEFNGEAEGKHYEVEVTADGKILEIEETKDDDD